MTIFRLVASVSGLLLFIATLVWGATTVWAWTSGGLPAGTTVREAAWPLLQALALMCVGATGVTVAETRPTT